MAMLEAEDEEDRIDNVLELKSIMKDISESYQGTNQEKLSSFLMDLALRTDVDNVKEGDDKVKLMSFHQSKGLEYKVVFMPAMEEGIFPSFRSMGSSHELEEERRICYVGITRAQEKLYFSMAKLRRMYGKDNPGFQSQFMKSINKDRIIETGIEAKPAPTFNTFNTYKPEVKKQKEDNSIRVGSKIRHKVFGDGVVVACDGNKITVAFAKEFGIRTLMADHPSITRI
jgi:DNA helicase-2/ATP-dependent DNA helicase PcrA